jgi:hypothetical protein
MRKGGKIVSLLFFYLYPMSKHTNKRIANHFFIVDSIGGIEFYRIKKPLVDKIGYSISTLKGEHLKFDTLYDWIFYIVDEIEALGFWFNINAGEVIIRHKGEIVIITRSDNRLKALNRAVLIWIGKYGEQIQSEKSNY